MCTLFIYRNKRNSKWPLLIASNRDEYKNRSFISPSYHWKELPNIIAGKDLKAGGTWLGINNNGLCANILNRESKTKLANPYSRGQIVLNALKKENAISAIKDLSIENFNNYNAFNLFIADYKNAYLLSYNLKETSISEIPFGYSIIDNLDMNSLISKKQKIYRNLFKNKQIPDPDKNNFKDWKKLLFCKRKYKNMEKTAVYTCYKNKEYATVSSSIIGLPNKKMNNICPIWLYNDFDKKNFASLKIGK